MKRPLIILACILLVGLVLWWTAPSRTAGVVGAYKTEDTSITANDIVEITYMGPTGPIVGAMSDVVLAFEQASIEAHRKDPTKPVYRVVSGQTGSKDFTTDPTRLIISIAGGNPPDVVNFDRYAISEWASRGAFMPMNAYLKADIDAHLPDAIRPEDFYKPVWDEVCYQGNIYGIPFDVDNRILFYNKDLFRKAGIVDAKGEPTPPRNWTELREYAKRLTERGPDGKIKTLGYSPNFGNCWFYMYAFCNGASFMSDDLKKCTMNSSQSVQALQFMLDLYNDAGGCQEVMAYQAGFQGGTLDPFITGKIAMRIDCSMFAPVLMYYSRGLDFGTASPPVSDKMQSQGKTNISWAGGWAYAIPHNARNKQAAWEFIRFMTSERAQRMLIEGERDVVEAQGRTFVPRLNPIKRLNELFLKQYAFDNPRLPQNQKDAMRLASDLLPTTLYRPVTPVGQILWTQHVIAADEACYGKKTPEQALDDATAIVQRDLDRLANPPDGPVVNWLYFYIVYAVLLILFGIGAWKWDTHHGFRKKLSSHFYKHAKNTSKTSLKDLGQTRFSRDQWRAGYLMASPWMIGFIIFGGGPLLFSVLMSFCDYDMFKPPRWIGLENFQYFFTGDVLAPVVVKNTLYMTLGVPLGMIVSLALALLLNHEIRGISIWRTLFYLPAIVPAVASMVLWLWIFNPVGGILNKLLEFIGIHGPNWLASETWSKPSLILMGLWGSGAQMLIWLAGLKGISRHYYEAAALDGAGRFAQFRHITIPMLTPYIFFNLVMGFIGVFQIFEVSFVMTQGGPANSTLFYVYHLFNNAFRYGHMGYASAMAWILFVVIMALTIIQLKTARHWVYYEGE